MFLNVHYIIMYGRKYKEHHFGTTLLHLICQEGYVEMMKFVVNPDNHSAFDDGDLNLNELNDRKRTPLHYVFAPPHTTFMGIKHGLDENLLPSAVKAEEIEELTHWVRVCNLWILYTMFCFNLNAA